MKTLIALRSNGIYQQVEQKDFQLEAKLELILIYIDGKCHKVRKNQIVSEPNLTEVRIIVSPEMLTGLITELQLHQKKMDSLRNNADVIHKIINEINTSREA